MALTIWQNLTDALNKNMSVDEMSKKYLNTFLVLKSKNSNNPLVVCYKGHEDGFFVFVDEHGMKIILNHDTDVEIINMFPERCLFNSNKVALEFVRMPNRQYKRGMCKDNVQIYSPVRKTMDGRAYNWNIKTIKDALFPVYPKNCEEAIEALANKDVASIAINPTFMLSQSITNNTKTKRIYHLWFSNKVIGYWEKGTVHIKHNLFKQEVLDNIHLFKPYKIEVS